jgi:hypothetical protein
MPMKDSMTYRVAPYYSFIWLAVTYPFGILMSFGGVVGVVVVIIYLILASIRTINEQFCVNLRMRTAIITK